MDWNIIDTFVIHARTLDPRDNFNITWMISYGKFEGNNAKKLPFPNTNMYKYCILVHNITEPLSTEDLDYNDFVTNDDVELENMEDFFKKDTIHNAPDVPNELPSIAFMATNEKGLRERINMINYFITKNPHLPKDYIMHPDHPKVIISHSMAAWLLMLMFSHN